MAAGIKHFFGTLYTWYGKKTVWAVFGCIAVLSVAAITIGMQKSNSAEDIVAELPAVKVGSVRELTSDETISLIGTVRAVNEARLESEAGGRVTSVSVSLGDTVKAGQIIAQLDNAAQRASVLQAEGSYEAALASAQQSDVGVAQAQTNIEVAKNNLVTGYKSAYTTASNVLLTTIDDFFANPNTQYPGLYISGEGYTSTINNERIAFQQLMQQWQVQANSITITDDVVALSNEAQQNSRRLIALIDIFLSIIDKQSNDRTVGGVAVESYDSILLADRSSLEGAIASLASYQSALDTAEENLNRSAISGTNADVSLANASIKQALGALHGAQANLEKTIVRSPIAGTVNSLSVNSGDYISAFTPIAEIANNNALEVSTFVGENDLTYTKVGTEVLIEGRYAGIITNVGGGIDSSTLKTEVKIGTETNELTNGDTVRISLNAQKETSTENTNVILPLTAIKFSAENGSVFSVEDGVLVSHPIEIGQVHGTTIEVLSDLDTEMQIVVDVRGLSAGSKVSVMQ